MQLFTYADYLKCSKIIPDGVREESEKYIFDEEQERINSRRKQIYFNAA